MITRESLLAEAEAMDRLAAVVSYAPDKARLASRAAELRERAEAAPSDAGQPPAPPEGAGFGRD
jgi:hypothetical protein